MSPENASVFVTAVLQVAAGWTMLSVAAAAVWCLYRSPGRRERLAVEATVRMSR